MDQGEVKRQLHARLDTIVSSLNQNFKMFLETVKIPDQNHQTNVHQDANLTGMVNMQLSVDKIIINCNELLTMLKELKMNLLLYDYNDIVMPFMKTINDDHYRQISENLFLADQFRKAEELEAQLKQSMGFFD